MSIFDRLIARLIRKVNAPRQRYVVTGRDGSAVKVDSFKEGDRVPAPDDGACPECGQSAGYYLGPSGGISSNVECPVCHFRWNVNNFGLPWDCIGVPNANV